jgi:RNA polymerase primary sigma factor
MITKTHSQRAGRSNRRIGRRVASADLSKQAHRILSTLAPREEIILRMRFGIGQKAPHSLEEVAQQFSLTREWIRQIEARALRKVRQRTRAHYRENVTERG